MGGGFGRLRGPVEGWRVFFGSAVCRMRKRRQGRPKHAPSTRVASSGEWEDDSRVRRGPGRAEEGFRLSSREQVRNSSKWRTSASGQLCLSLLPLTLLHHKLQSPTAAESTLCPAQPTVLQWAPSSSSSPLNSPSLLLPSLKCRTSSSVVKHLSSTVVELVRMRSP